MPTLRLTPVLMLTFLLAGCGGGGGGGGAVTVSINPGTATVTLGEARTFSATVTNATNTAVTWTVQEGASGGLVTAAGDYTAPNAPGTFHVVAASVQSPSQTGSATVTVQAGSASGTIQ